MKAIVISLAQARERREHIAREFARLDLPFEFADAVDARFLTATDFAQVDTHYRRRWGLRPLAPTEVACWLSHVSAISQAGASTDSMTAIFEDDAILRPELPVVLDALASRPVHFDLVSLARRNRKPLFAAHPLAAGRSMGRVRYTEYGAFGYVITKEGAAWLASRMTRMRLPVDWELMHFWVHRLDLYFLDAPAVEHDDAIPSQLAAGRQQTAIRQRSLRLRLRLRRLAWLLQTGIRKRIGFRRLVRGENGSASV